LLNIKRTNSKSESFGVLIFAEVFIFWPGNVVGQQMEKKRLVVTADGHGLQFENGTPFFG